ncbi:MAG TPA: hypothetical protein DCX82_15815 [Lachnospiraceae bacterium]|jgi:hypothetical protein|nr:hypothetical protein [Lachnospiraceae bacterium]
MINTYDDLQDLKNEIKKFVGLVKSTNTEIEDCLLRCVTKSILFLKQIQQCENTGHYGKCLINDSLFMISSLAGMRNREFYINYRSMIENYIRFVLKLDDSDETGVRNLFNKLKEDFAQYGSEILIEYMDGEYGKCCDFVHSNVKSKATIYEYYSEIIDHRRPSKKEIHSMLTTMITFLKKAIRLLLLNNPSWVDESFYKERQKLKYLIGEDLYQLYLEKCD